jgi:7-cyano-7-deazaguanine synthase in queuosine biosynthesis
MGFLCQIGPDGFERGAIMSQYFIYRDTDDSSHPGIHLRADQDVITGASGFQNRFGTPTSIELDLLLIAASVFSVDRGTPRGEREDFARRLELSIPIVNVGRLQPLAGAIEDVLRFLSNDFWHIEFRQHAGAIEAFAEGKMQEGQVLLFSGGLDSLAAAIEFRNPGPLVLVSHITRGRQTRNVQERLAGILADSGTSLPHYQLLVSSRDVPGFDHDIEGSQRTRSFMFLILAALAARRVGRRELLMIAENGQMAIHLPLNTARIGAFSTHTAHPDVLDSMQTIISTALGSTYRISNPYVSLTKAEVVQRVWTALRGAVPVTVSCWRNARLPEGVTHCGECVPCMIRRVAIETHGDDPTPYERDSFAQNFSTLEADDEARRNLADLCEFSRKFETMSDADLIDEWPELYSANIDRVAAINMYRRAAQQTRAVLSKYPGLAAALQ